MYQVKLFNKISNAGLELLDPATYTYSEDFDSYDAVMVRSAKLHDTAFPESLKCIARAGAGVNNIPIDRCSEEGIVVFNTPGANANAVKELVICGLLLASRNILGGIQWTRELAGNGDAIPSMAEKGKSKFAGPELKGKTLGIIGLGAIGARVANAADAMGMNVVGYDPYLSVDAALQITRSLKHVTELDELFKAADYITVHVPALPSTTGIICKANIEKMKDGVRIVNFARGELVAEDDIIEALKSGKVAAYVCDFASEKMLAAPNAICMPHLGASTPESEDNCAKMAAQEIMDYLEKGIIRNSVNFPNLKVPREEGAFRRICMIHRNIPHMINRITATIANHNANIENMGNRSKGDYAYTIMDTNIEVDDSMLNELKALEGMISVRVIL